VKMSISQKYATDLRNTVANAIYAIK